MILMGDECRRTQRGNNNAYCQDNVISWFNWKLVRKNESLRRFLAALVAFRRAEPTVRQSNFLTGRPLRPGGLPDVSWYNAQGTAVDWTSDQRNLVCLLGAVPRRMRFASPNHHILLLCHAGSEPQPFLLPPLTRDLPWRQFVNTVARPPADIYPDLEGPEFPADGVLNLEARSLVCYVAPDLQ